MSYRGRSHGNYQGNDEEYKKSNGRKKVNYEKSAEVVVLVKLGRTEQFIVSKYTEITLVINQNEIREKVKDVIFEKNF